MVIKERAKNANKPIPRTLLFLILLIGMAFVIFVGSLWHTWDGFPKGYDAYFHMTRIKYVLDFFPNVNWQYHWANGMPLFKTYAPFFHFLGALLVKLSGISVARILIVLSLVNYIFITLGIFGLIYEITKRIFPALLSCLLAFSSFALWDWTVYGGNYSRIFTIGLMMLTIWLFTRLLLVEIRDPGSSHKVLTGLVIILLFLASITHILMALFTFLTVFFIALFSRLKLSKKINFLILIFGSALGLAAFLFLPLILSIGSTGAQFIGVKAMDTQPMPWDYFFERPLGLGWAILPALFIVAVGNLFIRNKTKVKKIKKANFVWPLFIMLILFSSYALIGHTGLSPEYYYINGFIPQSTILFMVLFGSLLFGILLGRIINLLKRLRARIIVYFVFTILVLSLSGFTLWRAFDDLTNPKGYNFIPDSSAPIRPHSVSPPPEVQSQNFLKFPNEEDFQHRFAPYNAFEAIWFNFKYKIPQERDYYGQGILYPDWRYWFEQTIWKPKEFSMAEARMALDWFAIAWFSDRERLSDEDYRLTVADSRDFLEAGLARAKNRYLNNNDFELVNSQINPDWEGELYLEIELKEPSSILSTSVAPTLIYIGESPSYNDLFFNLSLDNYNSQKLIPIKGRKYIDDYELGELEEFDIVFLYSYQYHNRKKAYQLLSDYVKNGGKLIWEIWDSKEARELMKDKRGDSKLDFPEPFPILDLKIKEVSNQWDLKVNLEEDFIKDIDLQKFGSPDYKGDPWKYATSSQGIADWAQVVLSQGDDPIIITGQLGQGEVIWTGFNFNYHIAKDKNYEESKMLIKMIESFLESKTPLETTDQAEFINPEKREITVNEPAKGVLFRESYYPNWQAYLENPQEKLKIEYAGPGLMYIPLSSVESYPAKIVLKYQLSLGEKIGWVISLISILIFILYLIEGWLFPPFLGRLLNKIIFPIKKIKVWWAKEDEEE